MKKSITEYSSAQITGIKFGIKSGIALSHISAKTGLSMRTLFQLRAGIICSSL